MTDHRINAVIALACKWQPNCNNGICWDSAGNVVLNPPNYCGDLNAMHEAEQALWARDWNLRYDYIEALAKVENPTIYNRLDAVDMLDLTARQRAEAFLRTIGKWEVAK
jgi:hypothetical protein